MRKALTGTAAALAIVATGLAAVAPADAQRYRGGHYHGGYGYRGYGYRGGGAGLAVGAGLLGLAAGAAIASDRGYYGRGYYGAPGYYAPPPYAYGYAPACRTDWRWDGYRGRYFPVRYCY